MTTLVDRRVSIPANPPGYERKAVTLLTLGFGLVGLDRWIIAPLFPQIMRDLGLGYQDLGLIIGILGITWGISAIVMGRLSDRWGRKRILVPSMIVFSLLSAFSGFATSFLGLIMVRAVMGVSEGAFTPASGAAVVDASPPHRRGRNLGIQMGAFGLFGLGVAPILATQLLTIVPSWRWVFALVAVPGFIIAALMWRVLREPAHIRADATSEVAAAPSPSFASVFRHSNVWFALLGLLGTMTCVWIVSAMVPSYLTDVLHLTPQAMGFVVSALGFGGFIGEFVILSISDHLGRKPTSLVCFVGALVSLYVFSVTGATPGMLFAIMLVVAFFAFGLIAMFAGPIAAEAAPVALMSTAIGVIGGASEIFGGGIAPAIAGWVAGHYGLHAIFYLAMAGLVFGFVVTLGLRETAPKHAKDSVTHL